MRQNSGRQATGVIAPKHSIGIVSFIPRRSRKSSFIKARSCLSVFARSEYALSIRALDVLVPIIGQQIKLSSSNGLAEAMRKFI